jgi:ketosteroid isomerase-like protein
MRFTALAIAAAAMCSAAPAQAAQSNLPDIARRYVRAQQAVMQQGASPADVSALLAFYTDDYTYYHPQFGAKVAGRDDHRRGLNRILARPRMR